MDPLAPAWRPTDATIAKANLTDLMGQRGFSSFDELYHWSVREPGAFWGVVIDRLAIVFSKPPERILDGPARDPTWLPGARMNIVDSCFTAAADATAVVFHDEEGVHRWTFAELRSQVARFASGLASLGIRPGERVAIAMPMTIESVIAYLGTVAAGCVVVSIADSFAADEIATRLRITEPVLVVTQDRILRAGKDLPMYEKVVTADAPRCVVVETGAGVPLREGDRSYSSFLGDGTVLDTVQCDPSDPINILFSSGTTGEPKAIPWTHLTPIKAAMDGRYHQDIHAGDVVAWPTNLGWMMGPWLIFASLINQAAFALYDGAPTERGFVEFVADAGVTILGLVPSIAASWRAGGVLDDAPWPGVRVLSSTGEASVPADYAWLMERAGGIPVIEYCGGTEIGGGYISGTVLHDAIPATFTTPTLGIDVRILDDEGEPSHVGELFLVPPSIGMSQTLLNQDHDAVYYHGVPTSDVPLRRHGDHMERLPNGYFRALGRVDDTMNLSGIKVSSAEIERVVGAVDGVAEAAAVGVAPDGGGPSKLVIYAVPAPGFAADTEQWRTQMQSAIKEHLNPLFKVDRVVAIDELPRTASAKVMRRRLRAAFG